MRWELDMLTRIDPCTYDHYDNSVDCITIIETKDLIEAVRKLRDNFYSKFFVFIKTQHDCFIGIRCHNSQKLRFLKEIEEIVENKHFLQNKLSSI